MLTMSSKFITSLGRTVKVIKCHIWQWPPTKWTQKQIYFATLQNELKPFKGTADTRHLKVINKLHIFWVLRNFSRSFFSHAKNYTFIPPPPSRRKKNTNKKKKIKSTLKTKSCLLRFALSYILLIIYTTTLEKTIVTKHLTLLIYNQ